MGRTSPAPTVTELRALLKGHLAYFEIPTGWQVVAEPLPTLAGEKMDKKTLRANFVRNG